MARGLGGGTSESPCLEVSPPNMGQNIKRNLNPRREFEKNHNEALAYERICAG